MNKKLLTLAVAGAIAVPSVASAEAVLYGLLNVSLDYEKIDNVTRPVYNDSATRAYTDVYGQVFAAGAGNDVYMTPAGNAAGLPNVLLTVPTGTVLTQAQQNVLSAAGGAVKVMPGQTLPGLSYKGWGMGRNPGFMGESRSSRIGVKGSEDLGNGLKAIYQVEFGINLNDQNGGMVNQADAITYRNTFIGLAGDAWGTVLFGRHDSPLKISTLKLDLFIDTMADYNGTVGFQDLRLDNAIAYISPNWSGFQLAAAMAPGGGATALGGAAAGANAFNNISNNAIGSAYSIAAMYKNGPFYGSVAYEAISKQNFQGTVAANSNCLGTLNNYVNPITLLNAGSYNNYNCAQASSDLKKWRVGLGLLDWNGFSLTGIYEAQDGLPRTDMIQQVTGPEIGYSYVTPSNAKKRTLWQIQAGYAFGNFMGKAMYGQTSYSGDYGLQNWVATPETVNNAATYQNSASKYYSAKTSSWAIGFDYNFSKRTQAYVLYTATDTDRKDIPLYTNGPSVSPAAVQAAPAYGNAANLATSYQMGVPVGGNSPGNNKWDGFSIGLKHSF